MKSSLPLTKDERYGLADTVLGTTVWKKKLRYIFNTHNGKMETKESDGVHLIRENIDSIVAL